MYRVCLCGRNTIVGRYIDQHPIVLDAEPVGGGSVVLAGDLNQEPTVVYGIVNEDDAEFFNVPFDSNRYERHECPKETR